MIDQLGPVRKPPDGIAYCPDCGEYLGDYVDGILYKFGQLVVEPHVCRTVQTQGQMVE